MYRDVVVLTDVGLQAMANADAGGMLVDATSFKLGSSPSNPKKEDLVDILGTTLFEGGIHRVEVLSENCARFTFELHGTAIPEPVTVAECGIYLSSGIMLGRCVFEVPITLEANETHHFNCFLITNRCNLTAINVTVGDHSSIPSTPTFKTLQSPHESLFNVVSVLQGKVNQDGSSSPVLAMKYSGGGFQWAFTDHNKVFQGKPTTISTADATFSTLTLSENESYIVHIVSGSGIGATRNASVVDGKVKFDSPFDNIGANSHVSLWQRVDGAGTAGACTYPPKMQNIPSNWVLTRGTSQCPVWAPPKNGASILSTLYSRPSKLEMSTVTYTGTGDTSKYILGPIRIESPNYIQPALGGVTQHKSAFDISGNEIAFTEKIDPGIPVELRMFSRVPSNGSRLSIKIDRFVGDGATQEFQLSQSVENANYIKVYLRGIRQLVSTYSYDATTATITMLTPPPAGISVEIKTFLNVPLEGYSTEIYTKNFTTSEDTFFFELSVSPQSIEYVEINQSGSVVHSDLYSLIDNRVILAGPIKAGLDVEVTVYDSRLSQGSEDTNLSGIMKDAILTGRSLTFIRHNAPPVEVPIPAITLDGVKGIRVTGTHPHYVIESTVNEQLMDSDANFHISDTRVVKDSVEVLYTKRISITSDVMLSVHADFQAKIGPGFESDNGLETMEYVVGFRTSTSKEPEYGRMVAGTGAAGFSNLSALNDSAFSNASMTQVYGITKKNHPTGYIDIVVKMRVNNARIGLYGSVLNANVNIISTPRL